MKTHFKEQYALLEEEKKAVWDDCYVVLDANILLNFYRCNKDTSDESAMCFARTRECRMELDDRT